MLHLIAKPMKGRKAKLFARIEERLRREGIDYALHFTERKGEGKELAARYSQSGEDTIVVVGGDGTLNDVLTGIADPSRTVLGLIPAGTGNDFAAAANIPHGLKALDLILGSTPKPTDYLSFADGRRSLNIAGIGIDVDILLRCERMKHFRARSKYFFSLLSSLRHYSGTQMTIEAEGRTVEGNFLIATVCNGKQFGGGIPICPPAEIDDGKMGLLYVDCPKRSKILGALIKLMRGKVLSLPIAHYSECESAVLTPASRCTAQYDGELYEADALDVRLVHGALRLYRN